MAAEKVTSSTLTELDDILETEKEDVAKFTRESNLDLKASIDKNIGKYLSTAANVSSQLWDVASWMKGDGMRKEFLEEQTNVHWPLIGSEAIRREWQVAVELTQRGTDMSGNSQVDLLSVEVDTSGSSHLD